jgi:Pvc16 N-terminal domain
MATVTAIQGVDDTLKALTKAAVKELAKTPIVTVGPPKATADASLNWFLYRVAPNPAYRNMEPPRTGWRTARGRPPLALELHYLLTAFPGEGANEGDHEQFSHVALGAVMNALNGHPIIGEDDPMLAAPGRPLVEPLRITLESLDLEALSKLWTAAAEPMRLSVGYSVSLVTVDPERSASIGPPVRARRVLVGTMGPRLGSISPARATAADELSVEVQEVTAASRFTLAPEGGDPPLSPDATAWPVDVLRADGPRTVVLRLPRGDLAPGPRRLTVTTRAGRIAIGRDSIALTVVPAVTGPAGPMARGAVVLLDTLHASGDVEVFLNGRAVSDVTFVSPRAVRIAVPADAEPGPAQIALRAAHVAGPVFTGIEVTP